MAIRSKKKNKEVCCKCGNKICGNSNVFYKSWNKGFEVGSPACSDCVNKNLKQEKKNGRQRRAKRIF